MSEEKETALDPVEQIDPVELFKSGGFFEPDFDPRSFDFKTCQTRLDRNGPYLITDVMAALCVTGGQINMAASLLGRKPEKLRAYINRQPEIMEYLEAVSGTLVDRVEYSHTMSAIRGDGPAQRFILSTLGKGRGYTTRTEVGGVGGGPVVQEVRWSIQAPDGSVKPLHDTGN